MGRHAIETMDEVVNVGARVAEVVRMAGWWRSNVLHPTDPFIGSGTGSLLLGDGPAPTLVPAVGTLGQPLLPAGRLLAGAAHSCRTRVGRRGLARPPAFELEA